MSVAWHVSASGSVCFGLRDASYEVRSEEERETRAAELGMVMREHGSGFGAATLQEPWSLL